jgi:hypothetical protein
MPWFKIDDNLAFHHKVVAAGNPAIGLWARAGALCAQQLTDGFVPDHMIAAMGTKAQAEKLVAVGLWDRTHGGYTFHGWSERQPSKVDVEAERAAAKERMREYRAKKRGTAQTQSPQVTEPRSSERTVNERRTNGEVREVFSDPDPTPPRPPRPIETTRELTLAEPPRDDVERICEHLADRVESNGTKRPAITARWRTEARLMLDRDGRTEQEIHGAIDWCQADEFWRANILSLPKLRDQYDQLRLQAQRRSGSTSRNEEWRSMQERQMARAEQREREMGLR